MRDKIKIPINESNRLPAEIESEIIARAANLIDKGVLKTWLQLNKRV